MTDGTVFLERKMKNKTEKSFYKRVIWHSRKRDSIYKLLETKMAVFMTVCSEFALYK